MAERNMLLEENRRFLAEAASNPARYVDFLGTMAKYHKYDVVQQMSLFFHAPSAAEAIASAEVWEKMGHPVKKDAVAIPVLKGEKGREAISYLYDVHETENYQAANRPLWQYNPEMHAEILDAAFPPVGEKSSVQQRILAKCQSLTQNIPARDKELAAMSTAYVVMERLGLDTEDLEFTMVTHSWSEVEPQIIFESVNQFSKEILNPLGQQIREKEKKDYERRSSDERESRNRDNGPMGRRPDELPDGAKAGILAETGGKRGSRAVSEGLSGAVQPTVSGNAGADTEKPELPGAPGTGDERLRVDDHADTGMASGEGDNSPAGIFVSGHQAEEPVEDLDLSQFDFTADMSTVTGKRKVFARNLAAIKLVKKLEDEDREPTDNELTLLRSYSGFGGLAEAFNEFNASWQDEYNALRQNLTDSEFAAARASTLNAHYTNEALVGQVYRAVEKLGFAQGNILEPSAGNGRFFAAMPESMRQNSHIFGVELDPLSSRIAAKIYPDVTMSNQSFESTTFANNSFDMAISNVPFGNYQVTSDVVHRADGFLVHDYFIAKMLDEVRPGGLVVAMTSSGTMDKKDPKVREYLARHAELVTAIRLPNTAFKDAGTEVTADILVFKKREKELTKADQLPAWVDTVHYDLHGTAVTYNTYWGEHPKAVLGRLDLHSTAFGPALTCHPEPNTDLPLDKQLADYIDSHMMEDVRMEGVSLYEASAEPLAVPVQESNRQNRPYGVFYENGQLVSRRASGHESILNLQPKQQRKILSAIHLREATYGLLEAQRNGCNNTQLAKLQRNLNNLYDEHVGFFGRIQLDKELNRILEDEPSLPLIRSLEVFDGKVFQRKADIFTRRMIKAEEVPTHADTAEDALKISMTEKGKVDLGYMSSLTGMKVADIIENLEFTSIYYDAESETYQLADEYLSGDVRAKIDFLQSRKSALVDERNNTLMNKLYPDWAGLNYEPKFDVEKKMLLARENSIRMYGNEFTRDEAAFIDDHLSDRKFALLATGTIIDKYHRLDDKFRNDVLFRIEAIKYGFNRMDNEMDRLFATVGLNDVPRHKIIDMIQTRDPKIAMAYNFLLENAGGYPKEGSEEEIVHFLDKLEDGWHAYQKEKTQDGQQLLSVDPDGYFLAFSQEMERIEKNLSALEEVKPKDLRPEEIRATLGSTWIEPNYIFNFLREELELSWVDTRSLNVEFSPVTGKWRIEGKGVTGNAKVDTTYGTEDINALALCELALNLKQPKVYRTVIIDGEEKRRVDQEKTVKAQLKMEDLKAAFSKWLWKDERRAKRLADYYNRHYNNIRPREYNGEYLTFPGMAADIQLKPHQKDAIAHTLYGGNTLLAHCVGAGKTFEMVASAMEAKRLGLAHKSMFVVPKHLTEQTGAEFRTLYPGAKILVAGKKDFEKNNREEFCAKVATQDWDAVILGYTQFEKIPLSAKRQEAILKQQINELVDAIAESRAEDDSKFTIKQMESKKKELEAKLTKLENREDKDQTIDFEDLGIDRLYVDEAHYFKNLYAVTKMSNVAGVQTSDAQKTTDLYEKCMYLNEKTNGKGIVFATGTPVSNSMTELFTMQRYLQPDRLRSEGMASFDAWASMFGQTTLSVEISPEGKGFREKTRFAKFHNLPELVNMFKEIADIKTADMINLKVPECEYIVEQIPASRQQKEMVDGLAERAERVRDGRVTSDVDNMLKITNEGRSLALDARIIDPQLPDEPNSKVNKCISNVLQVYRETMENRSTQLIFCDQSTPKSGGRFSVYEDIKAKLIAEGVKPEEIAFIHDANNDKQKEALFEKVRNGEVRILLGSTDKLGVGTNVQDRLIATHDLDVPWRPADLEQRKGRIVRQGNMNEKVKIFRYVTEGTFDAYLWQLIENKQRFVSQIMTSKQPVREADDCDELTLSYSEIKACATGNPLIKEKMEVDNDIQRLTMAKSEFMAAQANLKYKCTTEYPKQIRMCKEIIEKLQDAKMLTDSHTHQNEDGTEKFTMQLNGKYYTNPKEAAEALLTASQGDMTKVSGEYKGMRLSMVMDHDTYTPTVVLMDKISRRIPLTGSGILTNIRRMDETIANIAYDINYNKKQLEQIEHNLKVAQEEINKPFDKEDLLKEKMARAAELETLLQVKQEEPVPDREAEAEKRKEAILDAVDEQGHLQPDKLPENPAECSFKVYSVMQLMKNRDSSEYTWREDYDLAAVKHLLHQGVEKDTISSVVARFSPSVPSKESIASMVDALTERQVACAVR